VATSPDTTRYYNNYHNEGPGISSVGSYQIAGTPFLSSSTIPALATLEITLPAVSRRIFIENSTQAGAGDSNIYLSFQPGTDLGVGTLGHWFPIGSIPNPLGGGISGTLNYIDLGVKCNKFYLMAGADSAVSFNAFAELTGIAPHQMFEISGSGVNDV